MRSRGEVERSPATDRAAAQQRSMAHRRQHPLPFRGEDRRILRRCGSRHPRADLPRITFPASFSCGLGVRSRLELSTAEFILTSAGPVLRVRGGVEGSVRFQGRLPLRAASSFKDLIRTGVSTDPQVQRSNRMHKFIIVRVAAGLALAG